MRNIMKMPSNPSLSSSPPNGFSGDDEPTIEKAKRSYVEDQTGDGIRNARSMDFKVDLLFDNLPKLMRTEQFAEHFGYSKATIYDWRYRGAMRGVPSRLFLTLNRRLYIRIDIFLAWLASQNPNLDGADSEAL